MALRMAILAVVALIVGCAGRRDPVYDADAMAAKVDMPPAAGPASGLSATVPATAAAPRVIKSVYGEGADRFFLFEPADAPRDSPAPVVIFLHGWLETSPGSYGGWIEHLVLRGNVVIFPVYQEGMEHREKYIATMTETVKAALRTLDEPNHVHPDLSRVATVGHSCGGLLAIDYAAVAPSVGLPKARCVFAVEPGRSGFFEIAAWKDLPADTLVLTFAGDMDLITGETDARRIIADTTAVPADHKAMLKMHSDWHGYPPVLGDHIVPIAWDEEYTLPRVRRAMGTARGDEGSLIVHVPWHLPADEIDHRALWNPFDRLCDEAFAGRGSIEPVVADRALGTWDDGKAIRPLELIRPDAVGAR